jgi:transposase
MIGSTRRVAVYAFAAPVDMRKAFDALSALVTNEMKRELLGGEMFLFVSKNRRRSKVLYFDGTGLCLFSKRLEKGRFAALWERKRLVLTTTELALFLEGSDFVGRVALSPAPLVENDLRSIFFRRST